MIVLRSAAARAALRWRGFSSLLFFHKNVVDGVLFSAGHLGAFVLPREGEHVFQRDLVVV
jgi:hypothetical protein